MVVELREFGVSDGQGRTVQISELTEKDIAPNVEITGFRTQSDLDRFVEWLKEAVCPGYPEGLQENRKWKGVPSLAERLESQKNAHRFYGNTGNIGVMMLPPQESYVNPESGEVDPNHIATFVVHRDFQSTGRGSFVTEYNLCTLRINPKFTLGNIWSVYLKMNIDPLNKDEVGKKVSDLKTGIMNQVDEDQFRKMMAGQMRRARFGTYYKGTKKN